MTSPARSKGLAKAHFKALRKASGPVGEALRHIPERIAKAASQQADPWQFLETQLQSQTKLPASERAFYKSLFRACASQLAAKRHLGRNAAGLDTTSRDSMAELAKARERNDTPTLDKLNSKIAMAFDRCEQSHDAVVAALKQDGAFGNLKAIRKASFARDVRRLGKTEAKRRKQLVRATLSSVDKWDAELVAGWLVGANGSPGFAFMAQADIAKSLVRHFKVKVHEWVTVSDRLRKRIERLGLVRMRHPPESA